MNMVIELDARYEQRLREIAKASGRSVAQIVELAIERVIRKESAAAGAAEYDTNTKAGLLARVDEIHSRWMCDPHEDHEPVRQTYSDWVRLDHVSPPRRAKSL